MVFPKADFFVMLVPIVAALRAIIVAYDGWYEAIYFTEEDTDVNNHLPRAMIGGVAIILGLYLLMNLAFLHVLSIPALAASTLPAADAARVVFPAWSGTFVTVLSLLTLLSLMNAVLLGAPRILFGIGRDGLFSPRATEVGAGGTPRAALLFTVVGVAVFIASGKFEEIIAVASILLAALYFVNYFAVIVLRVREPNMPRPFRAWGYPVTTGARAGWFAALSDSGGARRPPQRAAGGGVPGCRAAGVSLDAVEAGERQRCEPQRPKLARIMSPSLKRNHCLFKHAIVRLPGSNFAEGLTTVDLGAPQYERVLQQHAAYCQALRDCGLAITMLEADLRYPDSTFVEDTAVLTPRGAILTRPGAASREGEVDAIGPAIASFYPTMLQIRARHARRRRHLRGRTTTFFSASRIAPTKRAPTNWPRILPARDTPLRSSMCAR